MHGTQSREAVKLASLAVFVVTLSTSVLVTDVAAQRTAPVDTMRTAMRLRDAGNFPAASTMLRAYLANHQDNGDAARLLAETLYWQKDVSGAREVAEGSLAKHPADTSLRLVYGRILVETGDGVRAREVLTPVLGGASRGRADALLGKRAYWDGDFTEARRQFAAALRADSAQPEVRQQLGEILVSSAPWVRVAPTANHDDQPIDALGGTVEAGVFVTPLTALTVRFEPTRFRLADSATRSVTIGELAVSSYLATMRTEVEVAAGGVQRSLGGSDWTGRFGVGFRLPGRVTLRARGEHAPYLHTEASLSTPVMTSTGTASLDWSGVHGWLGQAAVQTERYPDANSINSAYAWLLAPILRAPSGELQLGYSITAKNASESRFELAKASQSVTPQDPLFDFSGRYVPYYTPIHFLEHAAVTAVRARLGRATTFRANAAYAVHATDDATVFTAGPGASPTVVQSVYRRTFSPWTARAALESASADGSAFELSADIMHTAFYTAATLRAQFTHRFGIAARRAAAGY